MWLSFLSPNRRFVTVFRDSSFKDFHVHPSDWKGGQVSDIDISLFIRIQVCVDFTLYEIYEHMHAS